MADMADIIVVGVDGSDTAARAAEAAAQLALGTHRVLHVVTAYDEDETFEFGVGSDRYVVSSMDRAEHLAETIAERLRRPGLEITSGAGVGKPHDVLLDEAKRLDAEVIAVGNRRMQGAGRLLGSIANSVAHQAPCDVYIVKTT
ncbi:MAG: universal stress protein [Actinomycetia bacterium]|nr:universal stress protein [Actinomycetes bacterium]